MPKAVPAAQRRTVVGRRRKTAGSAGLEKLNVHPHRFRHACGHYLPGAAPIRGSSKRIWATAKSGTRRGMCGSARAGSRTCGTIRN